MIVTFISQCEKKALKRTRRVLDAFANRIGDNAWQTVITTEGLSVVKDALKRSATKNTSVSCHWIRSRRHSQLLWIVGNRSCFNELGYVAVNRTRNNLRHNEWENDWHYLPLIKALTAMAALLHDWGKATKLFQNKLENSSKLADPLRHEWISCLLFKALVRSSGDTDTDKGWLDLLSNQKWEEKKLTTAVAAWKEEDNLGQLPLMAQWIAWLILSHHRLSWPAEFLRSNRDKNRLNRIKQFAGQRLDNMSKLLQEIIADWGYRNCSRTEKDLKECQKFAEGLLKSSNEWTKELKKWAARLKEQIEFAKEVDNDEHGCWRVILHHARLCLMLGDHYYSSCEADSQWGRQDQQSRLYANTNSKTKKPKQYLDEHLVGVAHHALKITQRLDSLSKGMSRAQDETLRKLKEKSIGDYAWQDKAVQEINRLFERDKDSPVSGGGFIVNMASTGTGKTLANAKVMRALSPDGESLRYVLAVGLRTLTLQTGDMYRADIDLSKKDLAVVIGSKAVQELHELNKQDSSKEENKEQQTEINPREQDDQEQQGSESLDSLLDNELSNELDDEPDDEPFPVLDNLFPSDQKEKRNQSFLRSPVLVCTIDQMMAATETCRGGKYILPCLRLLSSDLVIDEVDDFGGKDLVAIARLVHLAGMLGRKVMISSATIPSALAEGFFNAYQHGWRLYCAFKKLTPDQSNIATIWIDEFRTQTGWISVNVEENVEEIESPIEQYYKQHRNFVQERVARLSKQPQKRRGYIVSCEKALQVEDVDSKEETYFSLIKEEIMQLHKNHHMEDQKSGKKISFGVVRMANVDPCIRLAKYLLNTGWPEDIAPYVMAYHSRQILALRNEQEKHLDKVLNRKQKKSTPFPILELIENNEVLKDRVEQAKDKTDVIFILVATPVEEVGRDHDFDWAVVEPSSYRSIIQIAGRVLRHRPLLENINRPPNIALMDYNLKGLKLKEKEKSKLKEKELPFSRPGFESKTCFLEYNELNKIIDVDAISKGINAIPRIQPSETLNYEEKAIKKLADLEHIVLKNELLNDKKGAKSLNGYIKECWFLTAFPQYYYRFRSGQSNLQLFVVTDGEARPKFCEIDKKRSKSKDYESRGGILGIQWNDKLNSTERQRLWLERDYYHILDDLRKKHANNKEIKVPSVEELSSHYGELMVDESRLDGSSYDQQLGLSYLKKREANRS